MDLALDLVLLTLGFAGGLFTGLLGVGGAILMIPLLLFVPPALGFPVLDMKVVAGLSMIQVLFATLSGVLAHRRHEFVSRDLVVYMGSGSLLGSLSGGIASSFLSSKVLSAIFAGLALGGVVVMLLPNRATKPTGELRFNHGLAFLIALAVGLVAAMVGAGGAFILIPVMLYVLRIPFRTTIGSSLGIVFLGALAGAVGKIGTGQVVYEMAAALVIGAFPGAQVGGYLSKRMSVGMLRMLLTAAIGVTALKMWFDLLVGSGS